MTSASTLSALLSGLAIATGHVCHATEAVPSDGSASVAWSTAGAATAVLAAATPEKADPPKAAAASRPSAKVRRPRTENDYIGQWIGVEGMLLDVARGTNGKLVVVNSSFAGDRDRPTLVR